jgi:hypothetical protein
LKNALLLILLFSANNFKTCPPKARQKRTARSSVELKQIEQVSAITTIMTSWEWLQITESQTEQDEISEKVRLGTNQDLPTDFTRGGSEK